MITTAFLWTKTRSSQGTLASSHCAIKIPFKTAYFYKLCVDIMLISPLRLGAFLFLIELQPTNSWKWSSPELRMSEKAAKVVRRTFRKWIQTHLGIKESFPAWK